MTNHPLSSGIPPRAGTARASHACSHARHPRLARSPRAAAPLAIVLALLCWPARAYPCARMYPPGEEVGSDRETALIVWDEARHEEHFVRSAHFHTTARSFGFLVPTPSRPTLGEVDEDIFARLDKTTAPEIIEDRFWSPRPIQCTPLPWVYVAEDGDWVSAGDPGSVTVLDATRVAGLDATVLSATDPAALFAWLAVRGFEVREAAKQWLAVYVARKWNIVAFRYEAPATPAAEKESAFSSRAVRISFATDQPFYPYREPQDVHEESGRALHLFVAGLRGAQGSLADGGGGAWGATLRFSNEVATPFSLPGVELPSRMWLNEFNDPTTKRPTTDIVFRSSPSSPVVRRRPVRIGSPRVVYVPYELVPFALAVAWWWLRRRGRRRVAQA
jgi:Uncharacterized protein conserved in bacteria (DUF2330)